MPNLKLCPNFERQILVCKHLRIFVYQARARGGEETSHMVEEWGLTPLKGWLCFIGDRGPGTVCVFRGRGRRGRGRGRYTGDRTHRVFAGAGQLRAGRSAGRHTNGSSTPSLKQEMRFRVTLDSLEWRKRRQKLPLCLHTVNSVRTDLWFYIFRVV